MKKRLCMPASFDDVILYLESEHEITENNLPNTLVPGGKRYPPDLSDRTYVNKQVIIIAHEIVSGDQMSSSGYRDRIAQEFDLDSVGAFSFDTREELEAIILQLAKYFDQEIDPDQVIHTIRTERETVFELYLPIIEQYYYE